MKKLMILMAAMIMMSAIGAEAQRQQTSKQLKKECKAKLKEFKKGGWQIYDSPRTLDALVMKHYTILEEKGESITDVVGHATGKSKNLLSAAALSRACALYASEEGVRIKGKFIEEMKSNSTDINEEYDKFAATYLGEVEKQIRGDLQHSFSVIRTTQDGLYEVDAYYFVDKVKAAQVRMRAYDEAKKEAKFTPEQSQILADIINGNK